MAAVVYIGGMRRRFLCIAIAGLALGPAACRDAGRGAPLVTVIGDNAPVLGEAEAGPRDTASAVLRLATAQGLVRLDGNGQIEPGLAERWNVSDDGLSYVFRLQTGDWPDGRAIRAREVARLLTRQLRSKAGAGLAVRDAAGAIDDVVAMTDRVIEIRLKAPRPNLLTVLAHPDFALFRDGVGTGPFAVEPGADKQIRLVHKAPGIDGEPAVREEVRLAVRPAGEAVRAFEEGETKLVLGGTVADLPFVRGAELARGALRFDPASGLFGLVPARASGLAGSSEARAILSRAIDRQALLGALAVPGLGPRATLLEAGLAGIAPPAQPAWLGQPVAERRPALKAALAPLLPGGKERPTLRLFAPRGPGGDMVVARLAIDWGALGIAVERAKSERDADFLLLDEVAPSDSPAWYVRRFRCGVVPVCDKTVDAQADEARLTMVPEARAGLLQLAAQKVDSAALFLPIAAPVRWSLVDKTLVGFVPNRTGIHPLLGLLSKPETAR